jgi:predicted nucleotidyltransferase
MLQNKIAALARALKSRKIDYMVIGGQAVLMYGEPRFTEDIDITLGVTTDELPTILEVIGELGLRPRVSNVEEFVNRTMVIPCQHPTEDYRVDFAFSFSPYEQQAIQHANYMLIGRTKVKYISIEDLIIHKLVAGRPRDIEDCRSIIAVNPLTDIEYINHWLAEFEFVLEKPLVDIFKRLLAEINRIS